ncbi:MAG: hypothetical protein CSA66_01765 [Proteobacteria bacterium]|nr:MAG: hypothetical protein CSA66_01765 [Pseudomonadota bacterium]
MRKLLAVVTALALFAGCGGKKSPPKPAPTAAKAEPAEPGPAKAEPTKAEPTKAEPTKAEPAAAPRIKGPIAKVNGVEIESDAFYAERDKITSRGAKIPGDRLARIEQNILKRLIEQELIEQAVKAAGITVSEQDVAAGFAEYKKRFQSEAQFQNYLKHGRVTKESIEKRIRDRRALELLLEKKGDMAVTDEAAREFYDKNERFYTEKAGVRASHVLIKLDRNASEEEDAKAMEKVKTVQAKLKDGGDFGAVAKELSEGPTASSGGDLGFFGKGRMAKEFEDAAFAMKVGEVSQPIRTRFGYHIIKVTDRREDRKKAFDEVKDQIIKSLKNKKFFTERRKLLADLDKSAKVEKFLPEPAPSKPAAPAPGGQGHGHGPGDGHGH